MVCPCGALLEQRPPPPSASQDTVVSAGGFFLFPDISIHPCLVPPSPHLCQGEPSALSSEQEGVFLYPTISVPPHPPTIYSLRLRSSALNEVLHSVKSA